MAHPPLPPKLPVPDGHRMLAAAIRLYNGLIEKKLDALFPKDFPPDAVHRHLEAHTKAIGETQESGTEHRSASARVVADRKQARDVLHRASKKVDASYPRRDPARADFFPAHPHATLKERIDAMASGARKHGLPTEAPDLTAPSMAALGKRLGADENLRIQKKVARSGVHSKRLTVDAQTRILKTALERSVRGERGDSAPWLSDFGITPNAPKVSKKRRAKKDPKAKDPPEGAGGSGNAV